MKSLLVVDMQGCEPSPAGKVAAIHVLALTEGSPVRDDPVLAPLEETRNSLQSAYTTDRTRDFNH
jgi:hypothetical protein